MRITTDQHLSAIHAYGVDIKNREIYLHSHVMDCDEEAGVDYRCAVMFEKNIRYLNLISSAKRHDEKKYICLGMFYFVNDQIFKTYFI